MSLSPNDELKLTPGEVNKLVNDNLLLQSTTGKRKVSAAFLSPPTTNASTSSGSPTGLSIRHISGSQTVPGGFIDLPPFLDSPDTLQVCGFDNITANTIYSRYLNRTADSPNTLIDFALGHVAQLNHPNAVGMTVQQLLNHIGFSTKMKQIFAKPEHTMVLESETLYYWVVETLQGNYKSIQNLQERVKEAARKSGANKQQGKKAKVEDPESTAPASTATVSGTSSSSHFLVPHVKAMTIPAPRPGHTYLLKGMSSAEMYGEDEFIRANGEVNVSLISSNTGGDWNAFRRQYYFAIDLEIAEKYRVWAADRCENAESWVIHAQVPDSYINGLKREDLWWGHDFRWFTWLNRSKKLISPNHPMKKYDDASLLVGHTTKSVLIARMKEPRVQEDFKVEQLLTTADNRKAIQWVFDEECATALGQALRGNIHIDVFPPKVQQAYPTAGPTDFS